MGCWWCIFFTLLLHLSFRVCCCISCRTPRAKQGSERREQNAQVRDSPLMSVWLIEKHPYKAMHNSTGFDGFHCFRCFAPPPKEPSTVMGGVTVHSFGWFKINSKDRPTHPSSLKQAETKMQPKGDCSKRNKNKLTVTSLRLTATTLFLLWPSRKVQRRSWALPMGQDEKLIGWICTTQWGLWVLRFYFITSLWVSVVFFVLSFCAGWSLKLLSCSIAVQKAVQQDCLCTVASGWRNEKIDW